MEKFSYPNHPVRCIITGPSFSGKSVFLTTLILNIINDFDNLCIYSPYLNQYFYQKSVECFSYYIPIHIIRNIFNGKDVDVVIDEICSDEDFQKSDIEINTHDSIEELKVPQQFEDGGSIILDYLNHKEMNDLRVQAVFKSSRHNNLSIFLISQDYYGLPRRTIRANGKTYHIFKPNGSGDVLNIYQDKNSMDMTLNEFKCLTSPCWYEKYQPLAFDMTKDKNTDRYRLGLKLIFVPDNFPLYTHVR